MENLGKIEVGTEIRIDPIIVKVLSVTLIKQARLMGNRWKPVLQIERTDTSTGEVKQLSLSLDELLYYLENGQT